jgi:hypothetical protein
MEYNLKDLFGKKKKNIRENAIQQLRFLPLFCIVLTIPSLGLAFFDERVRLAISLLPGFSGVPSFPPTHPPFTLATAPLRRCCALELALLLCPAATGPAPSHLELVLVTCCRTSTHGAKLRRR